MSEVGRVPEEDALTLFSVDTKGLNRSLAKKLVYDFGCIGNTNDSGCVRNSRPTSFKNMRALSFPTSRARTARRKLNANDVKMFMTPIHRIPNRE
jgi:hypothetical protein